MRRILFFGDSNTYGFDPRDPYEDRYPAKIRWTERLQELVSGDWEICADGLNGRCIPEREFERRILLRVIREHLPFHILGIMLGTNDYLRMHAPDPEAAARKMERLIRWIYESTPFDRASMRLLLLTPPAMNFTGDPYMGSYDTTDGRLSEEWIKAAKRNGALWLNTDEWRLPMAYDRIHLTENGHLIFAERMAEYLQKYQDDRSYGK